MEFLAWLFGAVLLAFAVGHLVGRVNERNRHYWHTRQIDRVELALNTFWDQFRTFRREIKMTQAELAADISGFVAQLAKASSEILGKIAALEAALATAGAVTPDLQAAVDALRVSAQALDDVVPDSVP